MSVIKAGISLVCKNLQIFDIRFFWCHNGVMKPSNVSRVSQGPESKNPEEVVGKLGDREVIEGKIREEKRKFSKNCDKINILDVKNRGIFTMIREAILGATQEKIDAFKEVESIVDDLSKTSDLDLSALKNILVTKGKNKEYYIESDNAKLLKKALLIDAQTELGVEDAAKKTEAFYKFDVVIESKTKESVDAFKNYLETLGIKIGQTKNAGLYDSLNDVINKKVETQEDFTDPEIKSIRNSIFTALQNKKMETDHAALFQKMSMQHEKDEVDIQNLNTEMASTAETTRTRERELADLQKERTELQNENTGLKSTVEKQKSANSKLNDDVLRSKKDLTVTTGNYNTMLTILNEQVKKVQSQSNEANTELENLKREKEKSEKFTNDLKVQVDNANQQNQILQTENNRLNGRVTKAESDHKLLQEQTKDYYEIKSELSSLQGIVGNLKEKTAELANLDKQLTDAENKRKDIEGLVATGAQNLEKIESQQAEIAEEDES